MCTCNEVQQYCKPWLTSIHDFSYVSSSWWLVLCARSFSLVYAYEKLRSTFGWARATMVSKISFQIGVASFLASLHFILYSFSDMFHSYVALIPICSSTLALSTVVFSSNSVAHQGAEDRLSLAFSGLLVWLLHLPSSSLGTSVLKLQGQRIKWQLCVMLKW
jgi:hypothetical protein